MEIRKTALPSAGTRIFRISERRKWVCRVVNYTFRNFTDQNDIFRVVRVFRGLTIFCFYWKTPYRYFFHVEVKKTPCAPADAEVHLRHSVA